MIVVKIELWPFGNEARKSEIGRMYIANDGSGSAVDGSYDVAVCRRGSTAVPKHINPEGPKATRTGRVCGYPRQAYNVWRLIARSVLASFPEEQTAKPGTVALLDAQVMHGLYLLNTIAPAYRFDTDAEVQAVDAAIVWLNAGLENGS